MTRPETAYRTSMLALVVLTALLLLTPFVLGGTR